MKKNQKIGLALGAAALAVWGGSKLLKKYRESRNAKKAEAEAQQKRDSTQVKQYVGQSEAEKLAEKVKVFQSLAGILSDGLIGPITMGKLKEYGFSSITLANADSILNQVKATIAKQGTASDVAARLARAKNLVNTWTKSGLFYALESAGRDEVYLAADGKSYIRTGQVGSFPKGALLQRTAMYPVDSKYTGTGYLVVKYNGKKYLLNPDKWAIVAGV